jgi:hypothetical protein
MAREEAQGRWRRDLILVASLLIAITAIGWYITGNFSSDLRDSAVKGCERQNEVRATVQSLLRDDIHQFQQEKRQSRQALRHPGDYPGFSNLPKLVHRQVRHLNKLIGHKRDRIADVKPANCERVYP